MFANSIKMDVVEPSTEEERIGVVKLQVSNTLGTEAVTLAALRQRPNQCLSFETDGRLPVLMS